MTLTPNEKLVTTIDLIRHGEPRGGNKYRGQLDDPLSDKGWEQMRRAIADFKPWDGIVSSPLCRCADFAHELAQRHRLPLFIDERLKEIGFGAWEGRTAADIMAEQPDALMRFWTDPLNHRPPGAEHLADFAARVISAWDALLDNYWGQHILVVCHAGVIRMLLRHVLEMPLERMFRIAVPNASLSRIQIRQEEELILPTLVFHAGSLAPQ